MKFNIRIALYFAAAMFITSLVTAAITLYSFNTKRQSEIVISAEEYKQIQDILVLDNVIDDINISYYYDVPERESFIHTAAKAMVDSLGDPYAKYYTDEEYQAYLKSVSGEYDGVGVLIAQPTDEGTVILDVYDDTPAAEAGLLPGDIIINVDGAPTGGLSLDEVCELMAKDINEAVTLTIKRIVTDTEGETAPQQEPTETTFDVELVYSTINVKYVEHFLYNHHTGYIRISEFSGNCAEEFREAIKDLTDRGMTSLVIDLRNNPGGGLKNVVSIADDILGECTILSIQGKNDDEPTVYTSNKRCISVPLAIIVNEESASASEVLAAAVQDNGAGIVVGMQTFGKGIVQTTKRLDTNGAWLKLTTDAYFTPNGNNIHGVGVEPDIEIDIPEEMKSTPINKLDQEQDLQLWAALDYVRDLAGELD